MKHTFKFTVYSRNEFEFHFDQILKPLLNKGGFNLSQNKNKISL